MIQEPAVQVERMADGAATGDASGGQGNNVRSAEGKDAEAMVEEVRTPQEALVDPINDRSRG
jgi:hypothetical protein